MLAVTACRSGTWTREENTICHSITTIVRVKTYRTIFFPSALSGPSAVTARWIAARLGYNAADVTAWYQWYAHLNKTAECGVQGTRSQDALVLYQLSLNDQL
jgi:hypothetical protein